MRGILLGFTTLLLALVYQLSGPPADVDVHQVAQVQLVDDSRLVVIGSNRIGEQRLQVRLESDQKSDRVYEASNRLNGSMEYDEYYQPGDRVLVAIQGLETGDTPQVRVLSHYRLPVLGGLLAVFALGLLLYAGRVGVKSLLSFLGSVIIVWKLLIPGLLAGISPVIMTALTLAALSALIIISVAGWSHKGQVALAGTLIGLVVTSLLCLLVGRWLHLDGMSQPLAQSLLFETGMHLNMLDIFYAAIVIGASGAAMDVAMEMAATMEEIQLNHPDISRSALLRSGFRVGNAVIGTMTTTLLLAYSGGFLTLLMLFISRDTSLIQVINMKLVASEVARTLIGSLALVIVAPVTAWIASWVYVKDESLVSRVVTEA